MTGGKRIGGDHVARTRTKLLGRGKQGIRIVWIFSFVFMDAVDGRSLMGLCMTII